MREMHVTRTKVFDWLEKTDKRINLLVGSAGSSKSHSMAQFFIMKMFQEHDKSFLVLRKTLPALRITAYKLVRDLLSKYDLPYSLNKSEMLIKAGDGNEMLFKGLDDPEKIKSFESNYIWIEEATEINYNDFMQLNLRLRRQTEKTNQMYLSFNPISKQNWIYTHLVEQKPSSIKDDISICHSTYKDNPFLNREYVAELEDLVNKDRVYYEVYALGKWGVLKNIIYNHYKIIKLSEFPEVFDETVYGLDFGYNNPSALVQINIKDKVLFVSELLYEKGLTNTDLIKKLEVLVPDKSCPVYADTSEPARIEEIKKAGFNVYPSDKSVKDGIDCIKGQKINVLDSSVNLLNELSGYRYREDKDGNVLDEPVKFKDHLMDSLRYAAYTHLRRGIGSAILSVPEGVNLFK